MDRIRYDVDLVIKRGVKDKFKTNGKLFQKPGP